MDSAGGAEAIIACDGELAQLVERCDRTAEVRGSSPLFSIVLLPPVLATGPAMTWSPEAEQRLKEIPFFVRPAVRRRIESLAREAGLATIDEAFYEQAKARFGEK